jgi:thiol:disulfide interchange protein DsbG
MSDRIEFSLSASLRTLCLAAALSAAAGALPIAAHAAGTPIVPVSGVLPLAKAQALVTGASKGRAKALKVFAGPGGLTGVLVQVGAGQAAQRSIVWANSDGSALLVGNLVSPDGTDLNVGAAVQAGVYKAPAETLAATMLPAARAILSKGRGPVLTVFMDPNCIFCHMLFKDLEPVMARGAVRVRFVMVGVVKEDSLAKSATILGMPDPLQALTTDEHKFDKAQEEGGIKPSTKPDAAMFAAVAANNRMLSDAGGHGTPMLLYCSKASGQVKQVEGVPQDFSAFIADLATGPAAGCNG